MYALLDECNEFICAEKLMLRIDPLHSDLLSIFLDSQKKTHANKCTNINYLLNLSY